jgi:hypothetical protein
MVSRYDLAEKDHKGDLRVGLSVNLNEEKEFKLKELHTRDHTIKYQRYLNSKTL